MAAPEDFPLVSDRSVRRQAERLREEDRHLRARVRAVRAVERRRGLATAGDRFGVELFDPIGEQARAWHVSENPRAGWRRVAWAVLGLQQKRRHLGSSDRIARTVIAAAAARRDPFGRELLDPVREEARARDVREDAVARWRYVVRTVFGFEQKDRHLSTGHGTPRAVVPAAAAPCDAGLGDRADVLPVITKSIGVEESAHEVADDREVGAGGASHSETAG